MSNERILVVDDEANIVELVSMYLKREGFQVEQATDGAAGYAAAVSLQPDLIVLDIMLPEIDGFEVCRRLRAESDVPIMMLTARDDDVDKIVGLELGADDYLTKPFNPRELVARVKAILRRAQRESAPVSAAVTCGDVRIDPERREVQVADQLIQLRTKEFDVLLVFCNHPGIVLSRDKLLNLAWGYDFYGETRTVDVHVAQLRKRLCDSQTRIETVTGVGYKLVAS